MKRLLRGLTATGVFLALAACNAKEDKPATKPAAPAAAGPHVKAGLWEYSMAMGGTPAQTYRTCAVSTGVVGVPGGSKCSESHLTPQPDGSWAMDATCAVGQGGTSKMTGTMRGDPNSAYSLDLQVAISGATPAELNGSQSFSVNAKWLGDTCPANLQGGGVETPQGVLDSSGMKGGK